jgi:hypothetical protein
MAAGEARTTRGPARRVGFSELLDGQKSPITSSGLPGSGAG